MMPDVVIVQLMAIAFLHVFPQCSVGIHVGRDTIWTGNGREVNAEILYRTIDRVGDSAYGWTESQERVERDVALERRILSFRSQRYPQVRIFSAECLKSQVTR